MSTRIPRLRLQLTQNDEERPADTQVLCRQQMGWVILLGAFLALLCISTFRMTFLNQARAAWTHHPPAWSQPTEPHRQRIAKALAEVPRDPFLQLGALNAGGVNTQIPSAQEVYGAKPPTFATSRKDPVLAFYEGLVERFPEERAVVAACLRAYALRVIKVFREGRFSNPKPELIPHSLDPEILARVEQYVSLGRKIDPENGFFPTMLGVAQIAAHQDQKALASFAEASHCPVWHDYAYLEGNGGRDLLIRSYGDQGLAMHVSPLFSVVLPHFAAIRQSARIAQGIADQEAAAGHVTRAHAIRFSVIRLGSRIRTTGDTLIGRLVGKSIQTLGFLPGRSDKSINGSGKELRQAYLDQFAAYARQVNREAPHLSAEVEAMLVAYRDQPTPAEWQVDLDTLPATRLTASAQQREVISLTLLQQAGTALVLWATAAVLTAIAGALSRRRSSNAAGRQWSQVPTYRRVLLLGLAFVLGVFTMLTGILEPLGAVLVGAGALLLTRLYARGESFRWSTGQVTAIGGLGLALTAAGILALGQPLTAHWEQVSLLASFLPAEGGPRVTNAAWELMFLPLPIALSLLVLVTGFVRAASTFTLFDGVRVTARALCALIITAYLGMLLWTVPADRVATVTFEKLLAEEIHGTVRR